MPTYNYRCKECGDIFEEFHSVREKITICEECGGEVEVYFGTPPSIKFKGEGFYVNDSKDPVEDKNK